ncbi:hypothetical protein PSV3_00176 [Septimatrevirus PSV32]|uniref:Uncharacterized protein n=1 Tax=Pseudomonas phage PSV3 TaxID=3003632 RepID=A0AAF0APE6_9CAUD|nr:hypothetical protein PM409_gp73 [Pseudomonas phage PSV3]WBF76878.1 hypothetical protein PSV3_00176 [Pseudomonas phage PSV3]
MGAASRSKQSASNCAKAKRADLLNDRGELPDALLALLLAALGRGVKVETIRVELREGETVEQAVARVMAEREGGAATKH